MFWKSAISMTSHQLYRAANIAIISNKLGDLAHVNLLSDIALPKLAAATAVTAAAVVIVLYGLTCPAYSIQPGFA